MQENTNSGQGGSQKPSLSWTQPASGSNNKDAKPAAPATPAVAPATAVNTQKPGASASKPVSNSSSAFTNNSNAGTYVGIFVAGIVVGALIGWGFTSSSNGGISSTASTTDMTASTTTSGTTGSESGVNLSGSAIGSSGSINVAPSQQAGFAVAISKISVSKPTWLVVYEDQAGTRGNAIGAALFFPESTSGNIELLRATLPGQSYFVGQSLDNGDKVFSTKDDMPLRDSKGNPLYTQFTAK